MGQIEIKRNYSKSKNNDVVNMPKHFIDYFIYDSHKKTKDIDVDFYKIPLLGLKVIIKVLDSIAYDQFNKNNPLQEKQYNLFVEEYGTDFSTQQNAVASFVFDLKSFDKNYNYNTWKKTFDFLATFKKGYYTTYTEKGIKVETFAVGLISNHSFSQGKVNFFIYNFWLRKLIELSSYTPILTSLISKIKNTKYFVFYLFLHSLKKIGTTTKSLDNFNKDYKLNYKDSKSFCRFFLKPIKILFDTNSDISFNYSYSGKNITIIVYLNDIKKIDNLQIDTITKQKIRYKINYWKRRYHLNEKNIKRLKIMFDDIYKHSRSDLKYLFDAYKLMVQKLKKNEEIDLKNIKDGGDLFIRYYDIYISDYYDKINQKFRNGKFKYIRPPL